jgi:hypothetical protein
MNESNKIYYVKIAGKVNIPTELSIGHNYKLMADCSIVSEQKSDLENGEYSITYKLVPINAEIQKDNGETVKAKDPRRNSEKFRKYLFKLWSDDGILHEFDKVYEMVTMSAMSDMPHYLREVVKKLDGTAM